MKQRTWLGWALGAGLAAPAACSTGGPAPARGEDETAGEAELAFSEPTSCAGQPKEWGSPGSLTEACTGPWQYSAREPCPNAAECGCTAWSSCADWSFGASPVRDQLIFSSTISIPQICGSECSPCDPANRALHRASADGVVPICPCGMNEICTPKVDEARDKCELLRDQKIQSLKASATVPPVFDHLIELVPGSFSFAPLPGDEQATCAYRVFQPKPATGSGPVCVTCAAPGVCPASTCPITPNLWSAPGVSQTTLQGTVAGQGKKLITSPAPKCSTCDGEGDAQARYTCLETSSMQVPAASLPLVERTEMLVYERYGDELSSTPPLDHLGDARALYGKPGSVPTCGVAVPTYTCGGGAPGPSGQAGVDFKRCLRLQGSHVDGKTVAREFGVCAAAYAANQAHYATCTPAVGPSAAAEARTALGVLWRKQLEPFKQPTAPASDLPRQVLNFDAWYEAHAKLLTGGAAPTAAQAQTLTSDLSEALGLFWGMVDAHQGTSKPVVDELNEATPEAPELRAKLASALTTGDQGARNVVNAAFTLTAGPGGQQALPAGGLPLLALLGEALGPLAERLDDHASHHDLACQFKDCRPDAAASSVVQLYRILGQLGEAGALAATLAATVGDLGGWKPVFAKVNANRSRLDPALQAATVSKGLIAADLELLPPAARPLAKIVRNARARAARFDLTGQFVSEAHVIKTGQDEATRDAVVAALGGKLAAVIDRRDRYDNQLVSLARETLGAMDEAAEATRLAKLVEQKEKVRQDLEADVAGMQASADEEATRLGDILDTFQKIESGLNQGQLIDVADSETFLATGAHAEYTGPGGNPDLAQIAIKTVPALKGQMLQVQVSGAWTPTCGLRANAFKALKPLEAGEAADPVAVDLSDAVTGPEGYSLQWTGSGFQAGSSSESMGWDFQVGVRGEVCYGENAAAGAVGLDYKACAFASATFQHSLSDGTTAGNEVRATASYSKGLRLSNMPYPDAPVGSLLAVVKAKNGAELDRLVVQAPNTMIPVTEDADVYFVANDRACVSPAAPMAQNRLNVTVNTLVTLKDVAKKAVEAMNETLVALRPFEAAYAAQTAVLPGQTSFLRGLASVKLLDKLDDLNPPLSTDDLPGPLMNLFSAFVDREIVRVERAVALKALGRQLEQLKLEVESLTADQAASDEQSAVRNLLLAHMIRNLDAEVLRSETGELVEGTRDYLLPMLELWYPKYLAVKREQPLFKDKLKVLSESANLNGDLTTLANATVYVVGELLSGFLEAPFGNKPQGAELPIVLLSFPRPTALRPNPLTGDFDSHWRVADGLRSRQVWEGIARRGVAPVTIYPHDIYAKSSTQGTLPCSEAMPVIRAIRYLFGSTQPGAYQNGDLLNGLDRKLSGFAPENQIFLTELGPATYLLSPESAYRITRGSVLYGLDVNLRSLADASFTNDDSTRPVGLSPVGTYEVDFTDIDAEWPGSSGLGIDEAEEFVVAMQLDSKAVFTPPPGVAICKP